VRSAIVSYWKSIGRDILPSAMFFMNKRIYKHTHTDNASINVRDVFLYITHTNTMDSPIQTRVAPFVLKLEVTKRVLTSLASSFYSLAFRRNVQRGFQWQWRTREERGRGEKRSRRETGSGGECTRDEKKRRMKMNVPRG